YPATAEYGNFWGGRTRRVSLFRLEHSAALPRIILVAVFGGGRIAPSVSAGTGLQSKTVPALRSCEKLASGRPGRRNRLPHLPCRPRVCKLGGAGGFACRANSSHLLTLGAISYPRSIATTSWTSIEGTVSVRNPPAS